MVMIGIEGCTPTAAAWRAIIGLVSTSALYPPVASATATAGGGSRRSGR